MLASVPLMTVLFTLVIEGVTILARFGLQLQSTRDTAFMASLTFGYRIHHGYIGLLMLVVLLLAPQLGGRWHNLLLALSVSLILSDLIHHFIVLWWLTGDPQFHLRYPD